MTNSSRKNRESAKKRNSVSNSADVVPTEDEVASTSSQNGDMRSAIVDIITNDDTVMQTIIATVSQAIVNKLLDNKAFVDILAEKLMANGVLDSVKQSVYEASAMDSNRTYATVTAMESKLTDLHSNNKALGDEVDALEQYSRRNCLLIHGVPETAKDSNIAVIAVCNDKLSVSICADDIDRSHRLGQPRSVSGEVKPRPIIVKFRSYEKRRAVFSAKRKLKGSKIVVTENLTKRRSELLKKVRTVDIVQCAWTIDGRIVCLLENGDKVTVTHEREIERLSTRQR